MEIRITRKTLKKAQIAIISLIFIVGLFLIFTFVVVNAFGNQIQNNSLPNIPIGQSSGHIININGHWLNVSWEHINTNNLTQEKFILDVSQLANSSSANSTYTISPQMMLTDTNFPLSDLSPNDLQVMAYQYAPTVNNYFQKTVTGTCVNLSASLTGTKPYFPYNGTLISYGVGDTIIYNGDLYKCVRTTNNVYNPTTDPSAWQLQSSGCSTNSTKSTGWNYPQCNSSGQSVIVSNYSVPYSQGCTITSNTSCTQFNITTYSPVQIGSGAMPVSPSMFSSPRIMIQNNQSVPVSTISLNQMQVPAYSNTKNAHKFFEITLSNIPIHNDPTKLISSTGTFVMNISNNLIWDKTHSSWWNTSFSYSKPITITNTGSAISNYSMLLNISYNPNMNSDFSDLRFIDSNNVTVLGYALGEDVPKYIYPNGTEVALTTVNGSYTQVVVKIPQLLASQNHTIYMYYGNPSAKSESNLSNAFIFADDFSEGNSNNWQTITGGINRSGFYAYAQAPTISVSGGILTATHGATINTATGIETKQTFNASKDIFTARIASSQTNTSQDIAVGLFNWKGVFDYSSSNGVLNSPFQVSWKAPSEYDTTLIPHDTAYHDAYIYSTSKAGLTDTQSFTTSGFNTPTSTTVPLVISAVNGAGATSVAFTVDWAIVSAYASSIPTYSIGSEHGKTPSNTCTYSGSGNWNINASDFCNLTTNTNLGNNNFTCSGTGNVSIYANITNWDYTIRNDPCNIIIYPDGGFE